VYIREATALTARASRELFEKTGTAPEDIDYIIYINTTGLATPSIDARLINELGLRPNTRRTPIWGLGCAGGVAGLAHAYHYILGHPEAKVLLVAAELCGLTFMPDDPSKSNLVACALFGEGAAAALITGDTGGDGGLEMKATQSAFYPDSLNVMGWHVVSQGLQVVFDKRIPEIVANNSTAELDSLLEQNHLTRKDIARYLYHPGGMKVLDAYIEAYDASEEAFACSRETLRDFGNMSSVTVLFVLERYLRSENKPHGAHGVISALGPGFCSESILVRL
jgi:alkylresorcinol/alkylpyrone synthase